MQPQAPPGHWQFVLESPFHPWYDYVILALSLGYIVLVFTVKALYGVVI